MKYDYEVEKSKVYKKNLADMPKIIKNNKKYSKDWSALKLKIENFVDKFKTDDNDKDFNVLKIANSIKKNRVVAAFFVKDPSRQNFYQTQALKYLNSMDSVEKAEQLPASGNKALFIVDGILGKKGSFNKSKLKTCKSIDFKIKLKDGRSILASHKYTGLSGGSQDNQKNDLINFIRHAKRYAGNEYIFLAIADGPYYLKPSILDQLEDEAKAGEKVLVCNMENFEEKLAAFGAENA